MGFAEEDSAVDKILNEIGTGGKVKFDAFVNLMSKRTTDSDTKVQIVEAFSCISWK